MKEGGKGLHAAVWSMGRRKLGRGKEGELER